MPKERFCWILDYLYRMSSRDQNAPAHQAGMPEAEKMSEWSRLDRIAVRDAFERMDLCGCGSSSHMHIIFMLLERAEDHDSKGSFHDKAEDASGGWVEFGAKCLDSWDLIEHGTGIGWAWLTDEGKLVLRFLREFGLDDIDPTWPDWQSDFSCDGEEA